MPLLDDLGPVASLWGSALTAWRDPDLRARPGGGVQYLWGAYSNAGAQGLLAVQPGDFQRMNALSSAAAAVVRAERSLQDAVVQVQAGPNDLAIDATHWAPDIDYRSGATTPFEGTARVRINADVTAGGVSFSQWYTWNPGITMPRTVGGLLDAVDTVLQGFGERYQVDAISLGSSLSITVA